MITLWLRDRYAGPRLKGETREYLRQLQNSPVHTARRNASELLARLRHEVGPHVQLGETMWGERVIVPLIELIKATSFITGGMGAGKTMFDLLLIREIVRRLPGLRSMAFGVIDAKGELFERTLYLLARRLAELEGREREALLGRIVIIDFSCRSVVSSYNILASAPNSDLEFLVTSRMETLAELLPSSDRLSLRGATMLKPALMLLAQAGLPLTYLERVLSDELVRYRLLARSRDSEVRWYFERHFPREPKASIDAVRARMAGLLRSQSVRLALGGSTAPDFRQLQNDGKIVLVNCAGPLITRGIRLLLQGLVLSDIRQSIFARPNDPAVTYLWCADEAQNFFLTKQQQSDLVDVVTMGRSFGTFFSFLCQNLSASVSDARMLKQLFTNVKWTLTLRGTPEDAEFLRSALPITGRLLRPDSNPFRERTFYTPNEERALMLERIASLGDGIGYFWLKARSGEAIKIRTQRLNFPEGEVFRNAVESIKENPEVGQRFSREAYERRIAEWDQEWFGGSRHAQDGARWEKVYREQQAVCQI